MLCYQPANRLTTANVDSFVLDNYADLQQFQVSLGSMMLTTEPVIGDREGYVQACSAHGMWGRSQEMGLENRVTEAGFFQNYGQMCASLERSASLAYNGSAVSSNRPLIMLVNGVTTANGDCYLYLFYLRLVQIFSSSNVAVKE